MDVGVWVCGCVDVWMLAEEFGKSLCDFVTIVLVVIVAHLCGFYSCSILLSLGSFRRISSLCDCGAGLVTSFAPCFGSCDGHLFLLRSYSLTDRK
jgi:hypothetical protein